MSKENKKVRACNIEARNEEVYEETEAEDGNNGVENKGVVCLLKVKKVRQVVILNYV